MHTNMMLNFIFAFTALFTLTNALPRVLRTSQMDLTTSDLPLLNTTDTGNPFIHISSHGPEGKLKHGLALDNLEEHFAAAVNASLIARGRSIKDLPTHLANSLNSSLILRGHRHHVIPNRPVNNGCQSYPNRCFLGTANWYHDDWVVLAVYRGNCQLIGFNADVLLRTRRDWFSMFSELPYAIVTQMIDWRMSFDIWYAGRRSGYYAGARGVDSWYGRCDQTNPGSPERDGMYCMTPVQC